MTKLVVSRRTTIWSRMTVARMNSSRSARRSQMLSTPSGRTAAIPLTAHTENCVPTTSASVQHCRSSPLQLLELETKHLLQASRVSRSGFPLSIAGTAGVKRPWLPASAALNIIAGRSRHTRNIAKYARYFDGWKIRSQ